MSLLKLDPDFKAAFDGPKLAQELVDKIVRVLPLQAAYLFGSAAIGKNTAHSDLDILLVIPSHHTAKEYYRVVNQPHFSPVGVDWIIKAEEDFDREKDVGGVAMVAWQIGIKLEINDSN